MKQRKPRKKKKQLKGNVNTGTIFIGDASYFGADAQKFSEGIILESPDNPFKDWEKVQPQYSNDSNLEFPGSVNGDLPGRGVVIQTNMLGGSFTVHRRMDKKTGKLKSLTVKFKE